MDISTRNLVKRLAKIAAILGFLGILLTGGLILFVKIKGISFYTVSGASMEPTLQHNDYLLLDTVENLEKGLLIFFDKPETWGSYSDRFPAEKRTLVKRVVGLPGDTVEYDGEHFTVNNDTVFNSKDFPCDNAAKNFRHIIGEDEVMVLGDNAGESLDSRKLFCDGESENMFVSFDNIKNYGNIWARF